MSFALNDMKSGSEVEPIPVGAYPAIIQSLVTLGVQPQTDWKTGKVKPSEKRLALTYEFPTELVEKEDDEGKVKLIPRRLTKEYKVSQSKRSNIMKLIRSVAPDISDLSQLLGMSVQATVGRTASGNAKVTDVNPLMKGIEAGDLLYGTTSFDFYSPEEEDFKRIQRFQQDQILKADDYDGFADGWTEEDSDY
jgi:hypothetical protein